ncbi:TsaA-like domain-containing protein, partial [Ochromonadaceae sp. CCMP2298]
MSSGDWSLEGLCLAGLSLCVWEYVRKRGLTERLEKAYWMEHRGRARTEMAMKKISSIQLNTDGGFFVQEIGTVASCYRQCIGTPRQGLLVPSSRACIHLSPNISPESLQGLEEYSHIYIIFKFHLNTNTLKEAKGFAEEGGKKGGKKHTFTAKITLPMLKKKMGVFATRSPHRPNPFGITMARIERVDKKTRTLHLSACDLVQGTPVYDIKPYVPAYDTTPHYRIASWI